MPQAPSSIAFKAARWSALSALVSTAHAAALRDRTPSAEWAAGKWGLLGIAMGGLALLALLIVAYRFLRIRTRQWPVGRRIAAGFGAMLVVIAGVAALAYGAILFCEDA